MSKHQTRRRFWTAHEDAVLRLLYPHVRTETVASKLARSMSAVCQHALKLGLLKTAKYLASPDACRLRRAANPGITFRFKKGHVPANKGLRRAGWFRGRMRETQFKAGERTGAAERNWRPLGTILADTEGYLRIKVRDGRKGEAYGFGNTKIWPLLNRHIWEQHHGPIPPGHLVVFKDRNRANCVIDNLEMITLAENMGRNTMHRYPKELALVMQLKGALKRKIRKLERLNHAEKQDAGPTRPSV